MLRPGAHPMMDRCGTSQPGHWSAAASFVGAAGVAKHPGLGKHTMTDDVTELVVLDDTVRFLCPDEYQQAVSLGRDLRDLVTHGATVTVDPLPVCSVVVVALIARELLCLRPVPLVDVRVVCPGERHGAATVHGSRR